MSFTHSASVIRPLVVLPELESAPNVLGESLMMWLLYLMSHVLLAYVHFDVRGQVVIVNYLSNKMKKKKGNVEWRHTPGNVCHLKDSGGGEVCGVDGYPSCSFCEQWWWFMFAFGYVVVPCSHRQLSALLMVRNKCSMDPCIHFYVCE